MELALQQFDSNIQPAPFFYWVPSLRGGVTAAHWAHNPEDWFESSDRNLLIEDVPLGAVIGPVVRLGNLPAPQKVESYLRCLTFGNAFTVLD